MHERFVLQQLVAVIVRKRRASAQASCPYLVVDVNAQSRLGDAVNLPDWAFLATVRKPTDKTENMLVFKRVGIESPETPPVK